MLLCFTGCITGSPWATVYFQNGREVWKKQQRKNCIVEAAGQNQTSSTFKLTSVLTKQLKPTWQSRELLVEMAAGWTELGGRCKTGVRSLRAHEEQTSVPHQGKGGESPPACRMPEAHQCPWGLGGTTCIAVVHSHSCTATFLQKKLHQNTEHMHMHNLTWRTPLPYTWSSPPF